jgi:hypothetical protein
VTDQSLIGLGVATADILEPRRVGRERPARQPRPFDRALALLDPLLARAALVVERDHALGRATHVRHDEPDAGIKLSRISSGRCRARRGRNAGLDDPPQIVRDLPEPAVLTGLTGGLLSSRPVLIDP